MKKALLISAALACAAPAHAAAIVNVDGSVTFNNAAGPNTAIISFNGLSGGNVVPGLSAVLTLTASTVGAVTNFTYSLFNNSTATGARVSGIGFDVDPNVVSVDSAGVYDEASLGFQAASFAAETCFNGGPGNCPESNPAGSVSQGATGNGTLSLTFANSPGSITLSNFLDRYQGFQVGRVSSAVGEGTVITAVPEPATWAMMLVGFGAMGAALRRRKSPNVTKRMQFA